jgi:iron complex outermembrane receptor protein
VAYVYSHLSGLTFVDTRAIPSATLGPQCPAGVPAQPPICFDYGPATITTGGGPNLYSPTWTYNAGISYSVGLPDGATLTPRANYAHVGARYTYLAYSPVSDRIGANNLVSVLLTYRRGKGYVEAYGTNLTNRRYVSGQAGLNEFYGPPREYGVRVGLSF